MSAQDKKLFQTMCHLDANLFPDDFRLKVQPYSQISTEPHSHSFYEMVVVRQGYGIHVVEDGQYPIFRGDIFLITPEHPHTYEDTKNLELVNILFDPDALQLPWSDLKNTSGYYAFFEAQPQLRCHYRKKNRLTLDEAQLRQAEEIILGIELKQKNNEPGSRYFRLLGFMRLVGMVCQAFSEQERKPSDNLSNLSRVLRYFENNYENPVTLEEVALACGKSVRSLSRLFREAFDMSPIDYLINLRLEKGAGLLRSGDQTIGEIAAAIGFTDSNYFSKMFSRKFESSPRDYRKQFSR